MLLSVYATFVAMCLASVLISFGELGAVGRARGKRHRLFFSPRPISSTTLSLPVTISSFGTPAAWVGANIFCATCCRSPVRSVLPATSGSVTVATVIATQNGLFDQDILSLKRSAHSWEVLGARGELAILGRLFGSRLQVRKKQGVNLAFAYMGYCRAWRGRSTCRR